MLKRLLVFIHFVEFALYAWLLVDANTSWYHAFITIVGAALLLRFIIITLTFVIAKPPLQPVSRLAAAIASEYVSAVYIFSFSAIVDRARILQTDQQHADHLPILFVHGFVCNAGYWRRFVRFFKQHWGAHIATIDLEPVHTDIEHYAAPIAKRIDALLDASGQSQCLLVTHSMGGLATRHLLATANPAIAGVVTLGTPHSGTRLGYFSLAPNAKQMRTGSGWLAQLTDQERDRIQPPFEALIGTHDNIVGPQENARYTPATNTYLAGMSHLAMALDQSVIEWTYARCAQLAQFAQKD
ncbi:MAG: alpha/beta fold hydrolase [Pseudomonadota bacterium]